MMHSGAEGRQFTKPVHCHCANPAKLITNGRGPTAATEIATERYSLKRPTVSFLLADRSYSTTKRGVETAGTASCIAAVMRL